MKKAKRNYLKLVNEILNLKNSNLRIDIIGHVIYNNVAFPLLKLEAGNTKKNYNVVIQSGIHGDETVAMKTLIRWMQNIPNSQKKYCNFTIFPCMNPFGYNHIIRRNGLQQMVNTNLSKENVNDVPELRIIKPHYPMNVNLFIDIHGDCGRYGKIEIYAYERIPEKGISPCMRAFRLNDKIIPYTKSETIYGESCKNGVIYKPKRDESIQDFMSDNGCECSVTLEVPGRLKGIDTVYGSAKVLDSIIDNFIKYKKEGKL